MMNECSCWKCWFQHHFNCILLLFLLTVSLLATIVLMHEQIIEDKYVTWLEGWDAGIMTALTTSLTIGAKQPPHTPELPKVPDGPEPPK